MGDLVLDGVVCVVDSRNVLKVGRDSVLLLERFFSGTSSRVFLLGCFFSGASSPHPRQPDAIETFLVRISRTRTDCFSNWPRKDQEARSTSVRSA